MATDNSDYSKVRTNILDLTNERFASETNTSIIENAFNRLLTKDETVEISGVIGDKDAAARVDRRIAESDVHRQAYPLQPVMYDKVATVEHAKSSKDMYNQLQRIGVDIDRLPKWGNTERFNFAPPIDLDKLVNYTDYYWYDENDSYPNPQYVVIKNNCSVFTARLSQKIRETNAISGSPIFNVSVNDRTISLLGDFTKTLPAGTVFDVEGSIGMDGMYTVEKCELVKQFTIVTVSSLPNNSYSGGKITFTTAIRELTQSKNAVCEGSSGWDSAPWDDSVRSKKDGAYIDDAMQLEYIQQTSIDVYNMIVRRHPEYLDNGGNIIVTDARPLWSWMDQQKPEFIYKWDAVDNTNRLNDWQIENMWIHKLDLPPGAIAKSSRASLPIIEYLPNLELNEWSYTKHNWLFRADPIQGVFAVSDREPTYAEYKAADFLNKWVYLGASEAVPVNHQPENPDAVVMSTDSATAEYKLTPYVATKILNRVSNAQYVVDPSFTVGVGSSIIFHTITKNISRIVRNIVRTDSSLTITVDAIDDLVVKGDSILRPAGIQPYNAVMFSDARSVITLAGQQNTRVYIDKREQIGNYAELLNMVNSTVFVSGVFLDKFVSPESEFEVGIDPSAEVDKDRSLWNVRPAEFVDDQEFRLAGRPTAVICPIRYRFHQQHKLVGVTKFPLFDIYHPTGETAFRANEIFTYVIDQTAKVEHKLGLRIKKSSPNNIYHFKQLLLDYDNGPLFCYKNFDEAEPLSTIWRSSKDIKYVPRYVDADKHADGDVFYIGTEKQTAHVAYGAGDWEIPSQLMYNPSHENRVEINSTEILEHAKTILNSQATQEGFLINPQYGHRLLEQIDYSVGGTIHEHNDSWDLLASAFFATNATPIDVLNFSATSYETAVNAQEEYILANAYNALLNTSIEYVGDLKSAMIKAAITAYESNDNNDKLFGDTSAYINEKGIKNWPASAPILALSQLEQPLHLVDKALDLNEIKHHDGHISYNRITQGAAISIAKRVVRTKYTISAKIKRFRGWTPIQSADGEANVATYQAIPAERLAAADFWLDGSDFRRFEVISITPIAPSVDSPLGSLWLRTPDYQLMVKTSDKLIPWVPLTIDGVAVEAGNILPAWKTIDLTSILNDLLMEIETRLFAAAGEYKHTELAFTPEQYVLDDLDAELYNKLQEQMFLDFVVQRQISYPYASTYVQTNPFTWNVKGINANEKENGTNKFIWNPFVDNRDLTWAGAWQGIYKSVYGTYYPHLEPWVLQGFSDKPSWWDTEYKDDTGARRWKRVMWTRIIQNMVPAAYGAPTKYVSVTVDGLPFKKMKQVFNFVPVNIDRPIVKEDGTVLYELDSLYPVYDTRLLTSANFDAINETSQGRPIVRTSVGLSGVNFKAAYAFGDCAAVELEWRKSTQYVFDQLKIAFLMQPMRFMHNAWGLKYIKVGGLNINSDTMKVAAHQDTIFHGDVIDGATYKAIGINQLYSYYIRHTGVDLKVSNLRELWTGWVAKLAYQFGGFINTKSFSARTTIGDLIKEDYSVFSKKSPGYETKWLDSLNITVANYGTSLLRNGVRVPMADGKDWTFTISLPAGGSRIMSYYGTRRYTFSVVDEERGIMKIDGAVLPWQTGDQVYLDSTKYLPFPLDPVYQYYVTVISAADGTFQVSRTQSGAHSGQFTQLRTEGEGIQFIAETRSTFFAYNGNRTDVEWKHHTIDKARVLQNATPFVVQGIQSLIDVIDGYIEYKKDEGFVFNNSAEKESDWNTGRLVSWQTEIERTIDAIYKGLGRNNSSVRQYGNTYEVSIVDVNDEPDTFKMATGMVPFQYADRVTVFTTGSLPNGLTLNTPYYVIPDETDNTKFRLATTALNAYDEIGINVTSEGVGKLLIGSFSNSSATVDDVVEVNPFRFNLWINTPNGILADVLTGGDSYNSSEVLIYDQYGRPLPKGSIMVFRRDKQAHVRVRATMVNDVLVDNSSPTPYNLIHLGGIQCYIDGYEHIIVFNDYSTGDQLLYDAFIGMSVPRFSVEFERSETQTMRPNIGGYYLNNGDMLRNIEASVDDMRKYYRTYDVNENSEYVSHARDLVGYEEPAYLNQLNAPQKSKFLFWKGMIQQKGSRNAIRSFINSEHFVDAKVDEFWAYKLADFGDARPRFNPRIRLSVNDGYNNDLRFEFTDPKNPTIDKRFTQVTLESQTRWVDLPSARADLGGRNMPFEAKANTFDFDLTAQPVVPYAGSTASIVVLPKCVTGLIVAEQTVTGDVSGWAELKADLAGKGYHKVNSRVILVYGSSNAIRVVGYTPDAEKLDPIEIRDTKSNTSVIRTKYWNPAAGNHYYAPLTHIDFMADADPAQYADETDWVENKVGTVWMNTSSFAYLPYEDDTIFPEMNDRIERWGRLTTWATTEVYEWVASDILPSSYEDDITVTGSPIKVWTKQNSESTYDQVDLSPINSWYDHASTFNTLLMKDQRLVLTVFVNGTVAGNKLGLSVLGDIASSGTPFVDQYGIQPKDYVTFTFTPPQDLIEDGIYVQDFKFLTQQTAEGTRYYFWVSGKTSEGSRHKATVANLSSQLSKPQVPFHMFLNFFASEPFTQVTGANTDGTPIQKIVQLPARYTQVIVKDVANYVNTDNRYVLEFTRYFNLRDSLSSGVSALDLKNKHSEWYMFRREQPDKIPAQLWNYAAEALVGYKLDDFDNGTLTPVPSLERVVYDNTYGGTTRFGIGDGQAFMDRVTGLASVQQLVESADFDTAPVDKFYFLETYSFDTAVNIRKAIDYIFVNFSAKAVNTIFFELLQDAFAQKRDYEGLFKTSFIALHGIKILETAGNVSE